MKQRAFKEQVFKLLFRAEFYNENTKEELLEQLPFYFESGDLTVSEEDYPAAEQENGDTAAVNITGGWLPSISPRSIHRLRPSSRTGLRNASAR